MAAYMKVMFGIVVAIVSLRGWLVLPEPFVVLGFLVVTLAQRKRIPRFFIGLTMGCLVAFSAATLHMYKISHALTVTQNTTIAGKVGSLFTGENQQTSVIFDVDTVNGQKLTLFERFRIRLYWRSESPVKQGQRWEITARVREPYGRVNEAGFDAETYFLSKHIHAKGSVLSARLRDETVSVRQSLFDRVLPSIKPLESARFLVALAFGERAMLTSEDWARLQNSGLAHLLAISGLHIGLAFLFSYTVTKWVRPLITQSDHSLWIPAFVGLVTAVCYAWLAGFSLTSLRALVALSVYTAIRLSGYSVSPFNTLLLVLTVVLVIDPLSVFSISFWLSFGAVFVLCMMTFSGQMNNAEGIRGYIWQLFRMQCYLLVGMLPVMWAGFGGVSFLSLFSNLIAVPIVSLLTVPLILIALVMEWFPVAPLFWQMADMSLWPIAQILDKANMGWLDIQNISLVFVLVVVVFLYGVIKVKLIRIPVLGVIVMITLLSWRQHQQAADSWQLDVFDVGHGLAVLIEKNHHAILYDTGAAWQSGTIAQSVLAPVLSRRRTSLDGLVLSHSDNDHAGGAQWVIENLKPDWIRAADGSFRALPCVKGEQWEWQGLRFDVLYPLTRSSDAGNESSCVIRVSDGLHTVLLTGDLPKAQENGLVDQNAEVQADVLIVPHHGSKTSSSPSFLDAVNPSVAIASTGRYTPWNLPNPGVVDRYHERNISWYETGQHGQVGVHFSNKGWWVSSQRLDLEPFWYRKIFGPPQIKE